MNHNLWLPITLLTNCEKSFLLDNIKLLLNCSLCYHVTILIFTFSSQVFNPVKNHVSSWLHRVLWTPILLTQVCSIIQHFTLYQGILAVLDMLMLKSPNNFKGWITPYDEIKMYSDVWLISKMSYAPASTTCKKKKKKMPLDKAGMQTQVVGSSHRIQVHIQISNDLQSEPADHKNRPNWSQFFRLPLS